MKKKNLRQILIPAFIITACIPIAIFTVISQARLKKSTLDNMNNQAEADLQKSNQCLNMTLDKYETILYDITTAEDFLNLAVTAKESADIMETDAYNMRSEFSHICNRNQGVDGIQLVLADRKRIFYDRLSSSSVNSSWIEKVAVPETEEMLSYIDVLVDGEFVQEKKDITLKFRGSSNQRVLKLENGKVVEHLFDS